MNRGGKTLGYQYTIWDSKDEKELKRRKNEVGSEKKNMFKNLESSVWNK